MIWCSPVLTEQRVIAGTECRLTGAAHSQTAALSERACAGTAGSIPLMHARRVSAFGRSGDTWARTRRAPASAGAGLHTPRQSTATPMRTARPNRRSDSLRCTPNDLAVQRRRVAPSAASAGQASRMSRGPWSCCCSKAMRLKKVDAEGPPRSHRLRPRGQLSGSYWNSRSSCEQRQALAIFAAHWTAASRDGSSRTQKPPSNSLVCG